MTNGVPGKSFGFANMRHRVTVQAPIKTIATSGQSTKEWKPWVANEPAEYVETGGGEHVRGKQIEAGIDAIFRVNYRKGYCPEMRLIWNEQTYGIVRCAPVDGLNRFLELHCKATP